MIHLSDELLERALAEIRQEELNNLPSDEELKNKYSIPKRFDRKILHLIRDERRSPWMRNLTHYAKRVAVFFLALLIAAGTTIMTVSAAREWFFKVISQVFPTHTQIDFTPAESLQEEIPFVGACSGVYTRWLYDGRGTLYSGAEPPCAHCVQK